MFSSELVHDGHTKRLTIVRSAAGWDLCEEVDSHIIRAVRYTDWHRVERARQLFALANRIALEPLALQ